MAKTSNARTTPRSAKAGQRVPHKIVTGKGARAANPVGSVNAKLGYLKGPKVGG